MPMNLIYLVRHGENDVLRHSIAGRSPGVSLNAAGRDQAQRLACVLARESHAIRRIYSSPLERARETAQPLAERLAQPVHLIDGLLELDFGEWTGKSMEELQTSELWNQWNTFRGGGRIPGGETMLTAQHRIVSAIETLRREHPGENLALFSHGDPIRAALLYYLGMPIDFLHRLAIHTASVSILELHDWGAQARAINCAADFGAKEG